MTDAQRELARHALGLPNDRRRTYRNRYVCPNGVPAHEDWCAMVAAGEAVMQRDIEIFGWMTLFALTIEGARLALLPGESLDPEDFPT